MILGNRCNLFYRETQLHTGSIRPKTNSEGDRDFVVEQTELGDEIMTRKMMGEYLLYYQGRHVGGIYDNRLLVKKTSTNAQFHLPDAVPYPGAKPLLQVNVDDRDEVREVIVATAAGMK